MSRAISMLLGSLTMRNKPQAYSPWRRFELCVLSTFCLSVLRNKRTLSSAMSDLCNFGENVCSR